MGCESSKESAGGVAASPVRLKGWEGYNARFNGEFVQHGKDLNNRPVFRHVDQQWCRMYCQQCQLFSFNV